MKDTGYSSLLRQFRNAERARNKDYTDQAMVAYTQRVATINASSEPQEVKDRQLASAYRQWTVFMQRDMPANG